MRYLFLVFLLVFSLNNSFLHCVSTADKITYEEKNEPGQCVYYSLDELLERVAPNYIPSIREAVSRISLENSEKYICFTPLLGGLSKCQLFRMEVKGKKYVLRLLDEKKPIEKRRSEIEGHRIGAQLTIAPKLLYYDHASLVMVMEFIEGRTFSRSDLNNKALVRSVMQTLKKFHTYRGEEHLIRRSKTKAHQELYERCLKKGVVYPSGFDGYYRELQEVFARLPRPWCPSHGDMNPGNILIAKDGRIMLIDWAEATIDNPFFDIGWLSCFSAANVDQIQGLLQAYLERPPTEMEVEETLFMRDFTTFFVATLWIGRQEERDQHTLDGFMSGPLKRSSEYIKDGITTNQIAQKKGRELTVYALGWLKEFIDSRNEKTSAESILNSAEIL